MPTNLPPEYYPAEERYKAATTPQEKIARLEELISTVPKHKGTDKLRADLRRRLSKLKTDSHTKKGGSRHVSAYQIEKEGAAQVAIIGPPNVGKSALLTALTNANPEVADFPFTTWTPTPGIMLVDYAPIQLIDTPPLHQNYIDPEFLDLIRRSDLLLLVIDLLTDPLGQLEKTLGLLEENNIKTCLHDPNEENEWVQSIPILVVVNKYDGPEAEDYFEILQELLGFEWPLIPVSAITGRNLARLKEKTFNRLELIRVYSKPPGMEPDLTTPFVLKKGSTVEEFAGKVHQDFLDHLKSARVWGSGVFEGQMVGRDHVLCDRDVVELRI